MKLPRTAPATPLAAAMSANAAAAAAYGAELARQQSGPITPPKAPHGSWVLPPGASAAAVVATTKPRRKAQPGAPKPVTILQLH